MPERMDFYVVVAKFLLIELKALTDALRHNH